MFHSTSSAFGHRPAANAYASVGATTAVDGASPHKLVTLLFDALMDQIARAKGAIARGDVAGKGRAISHAVRIVEEGLIVPLDLQAGGELAANLRDLYEYVVMRLTQANLHNDVEKLAECQRLLQPIQDAWRQIEPPARAAA